MNEIKYCKVLYRLTDQLKPFLRLSFPMYMYVTIVTTPTKSAIVENAT